MRSSFFWIALGLIGLSWIANSLYAQSQKLDEPIFLKQYTKVDMTEESPVLTFYYLTNKDDRSSASAMRIEGIETFVNGTHSSYERDRSDLNVQTFTHHVLRKMEVELRPHVLEPLMKEGTVSFTTMKIWFSTGGEMEVPIGAIILQEPQDTPDPLRHMSSGSHSEWMEEEFQATEPLVIEKFEVLPDAGEETIVKVVQDAPSLGSITEWDSLPGTDYRQLELPMSMEADDKLYVFRKRLSDAMEPLLSISGTTHSGEEFHGGMYSSFAPSYHLTQEQVKEIVKEKKKKEAPAS
ncbi:UDP-glucose 6-dehydrogenase [Bacillus sp. OxB-1]|uniref:hypothetical protein n=1 Tax=Bacillus sp. (strain OxB-1) TaxID=98228 RepID=UPI000582267A|nr:hypothetical protein [Bacillus sp. OxB-1]BAQ09688.1 UDP-glucose 6-dehydrogenase [Bacillus sp. OxB-1]